MFFVGVFVGCFRGIPDALARSVLRKNLHSLELGKINSLIGALQALSALVGAPLYSFVYVRTLSTRPATFLHINTIILFAEMFLFR